MIWTMNIEIIQPKIFIQGNIIAGVTLRNLSIFPQTGFTLSKGSSENIELIEKHRKILAEYLSTTVDKLKFQKQVHGINIRYVDVDSPENISDGMITNKRGIYLCISIADCCAVLIYDPINSIIAALHCGWRGAKENIVKFGINKMINEFQINPSDLFVYLSPCASGKNYEVGEDVARFFPDAVNKRSENKFLLDLRKVIKKHLVECNVKEENIEISDECTISDARFHSHRRDGVLSGRMVAFIGMI